MKEKLTFSDCCGFKTWPQILSSSSLPQVEANSPPSDYKLDSGTQLVMNKSMTEGTVCDSWDWVIKGTGASSWFWLLDHSLRRRPAACCEDTQATLGTGPGGEMLRLPANSHMGEQSKKETPLSQSSPQVITALANISSATSQETLSLNHLATPLPNS